MTTKLQHEVKKKRPFESPEQEAALSVVRTSDQLQIRFARLLRQHGLTPSQYNVLRILRGVHPEGHPRCEIARRMLERAPDVTRLIDRLEKRGWVARDRSERDRRLSISRITAAGLDLLEKIGPSLEGVQRELAARLPQSDCRELSRICEAIYGEAAE